MTAKEQLIQEIQYTPEPLIEEVLNFLLLAKNRQSLEPKTTGNQEADQPIWKYAQKSIQDHDLNPNFWDAESLSSQSIPVITDIHLLAASFWKDEPLDEFDQFIASSRQADNV